jgi:cytochrome c556
MYKLHRRRDLMTFRGCIAAVVLSAGFASAALAHSGATGVVKQRMETMKSMGDTMKQLGAMMQGKQAFDAAIVAGRTSVMKQHAAELPKMFPKGSTQHPSEALPKIWESFEAFSKITSELESTSSALGDVKSADALPVAMTAVGKTCKACHQDYRKP